MIDDAVNLEGGSNIEADICIIGAGAAGITLAREFQDTKLNVVLLESGDFDFDERTQSLYKGENVSFDPYPLDIVRFRLLGGTTNAWGGMCRPLDAFEFEPLSYMPKSGWPISWADLHDYYQRAQAVCQLGPFIYDDEEYWNSKAGQTSLPLLGQNLRTIFYQRSPVHFGISYREELQQSKNVRVLLHSNVQELELEKLNADVKRVRVACIDGPGFYVSAKVFIVASGGLETARILLLSNTTQKEGLGNSSGLLGRYFMDHMHLWAGNIQFSSDQAKHAQYFKRVERQVGSASIGAFVAPTQDFLRKEGLGNFRIEFNEAAPPKKGMESARVIKESLSKGELPSDLAIHLGNVIGDFDEVANSAYKTLFNTNKDLFEIEKESKANVGMKYADIRIVAEQAPNFDSRVTLSEEKDLFGQRRIKLDWRL